MLSTHNDETEDMDNLCLLNVEVINLHINSAVSDSSPKKSNSFVRRPSVNEKYCAHIEYILRLPLLDVSVAIEKYTLSLILS